MSLYLIAMGDNDDDIQAVKARHADELMAQPGVVSVGIGLGKNEQPAIVIGIEARDPDIVGSLPTQLDGHPVELRVVGGIRAQ